MSATKLLGQLRGRGVPDPGDTAVSHLRHTLAVWADAEDDDMPILATSNVYGDRETTGLTFGDLRELLWIVEALYEDTP